MKDLNKDAASLINAEMGVEGLVSESENEEEMIQMIAQRVNEMMETEIDLLFSYLYRLDVSESKVNAILVKQDGQHAILSIARLIWERQKERLKTKAAYKQDKTIEGWEW